MVARPDAWRGLVERWPATDPDRIQVYAVRSPNGVKVLALLEECGTPYDYHHVEFGRDGTKSSAFLAANPDGRIPLVLIPQRGDGAPLLMAESNAILMHVAAAAAGWWPEDPRERAATVEWLMWQASSLGPSCGRIGFFTKFDGRDMLDTSMRDRDVAEVRRLLSQLEDAYGEADWLIGGRYGIADIAVLALLRNLVGFYEARDLVRFDEFPHTAAALERWCARPAVRRATEG